jgi:hypothetical protein
MLARSDNGLWAFQSDIDETFVGFKGSCMILLTAWFFHQKNSSGPLIHNLFFWEEEGFRIKFEFDKIFKFQSHSVYYQITWKEFFSPVRAI